MELLLCCVMLRDVIDSACGSLSVNACLPGVQPWSGKNEDHDLEKVEEA